jgi:hypothetical protein
MVQTASPHTKRVEWWKKYNNHCTFFFMKEWSLPELIVGYVLDHDLFVAHKMYIFTAEPYKLGV